GRLVIVPAAVTRSAPDFVRLVCEHGVTVLNQTPSAFRAFARAEADSGLSHQLRWVIFGGEALETASLGEWYQRHAEDAPQLVNMYGITETTVHVTWHLLTRADTELTHSPVGRRIADLRLYLLDEQQQPVPTGASGELYVGGAGVARGYLNRPELSAERFLPDPFSPLPGARMYRAGDLARFHNDGSLIYLGRNDDQVKIRGFRIEPGEIAACLGEHPEVREAAVIARTQHGEPQLLAYVVTQQPLEDLASVLRTFLADRLPAYMIPAAYIALAQLPLTANGKLDRRALPEPDDSAFARSAFAAPQGEIEQALAAIWQQLLNVERVSRFDNFFALGGHSLLAVQLMERLRRRQLPASVQAVFTTRTLAELAATLGQQQEVSVPPLLIGRDCGQITPEMLPLISLSQEEIDSLTARLPGGVAAIQDIYGLSPLQEGILFHHLMSDKGDPYLLIAQLRFDDRAALLRYAAALDRVVARHDVLRTAFVWQGLSEPAQLVLREVDSVLTELELDDSAPAPEQLLARFHPRHYRLDLGQAPLLRLIAARGDDGRWYAVQLWHHLIGDHTALAIQQEEIAAICEGRGDSLTPPAPYRNLVAHARLGISQRAQEDFFSAMLGDIDTPTLPFGLSDVHADGQGVREAHLALPDALSRGLREQARQLGVSLASLCHLAWGQVLAHTSGNQQVVFGTVLLGRLQAGPEADRILGLFVNTLPLRLDIDQRGTREAVQETHAALSRLLGHEHASLALAQRCSGIAAPAPLFSALLNYRHNDTDVTQPLIDGVDILTMEERTNYPFVLSVEDNDRSLGLTAQSVAAVPPERICALMQQAMLSLLAALQQSPETPVHHLNILPPQERRQLLLDANVTPAAADTRCLHQHFEQHAARSPHAVALAWDGGTLTYGELNARANRLAHRLLAEGVQPDQLVALCADRSPQLTIGLLAILKAGAAYLPLDPAYAGERLAYILDDARPALLLADEAGRTALGDTGLNTIALDSTDDDGWPAENPHCAVAPHHLAYVIYTSGSTGQPKGVMVEHRQVDRLFHATAPTFGFSERDTWCLFHSFSFDFSVWEIWGAWCYGGRLVIVPAAVTRSAPDFVRLVCEHGVTVLNQTPSAFRAFARAEADSGLSHQLRWVIFGGEALETASLGEWYQRHAEDAPQLVNMYGITETTVHVTWHLLTRADTELTHSPVGRRVADLRLYLLDEQQQPVPAGASGELYVGGAGVARGYLNRPELSAERFLPDPFSPLPGARMYRAGDLARYLPDGSLAYLGRNDDQVKIRGFRIEPGEIAARLGEHPAVREAAVIARTQHGEPQLVAYVTLHQPCDALAETLRDHLQTRLPAYMIPAAYIALAQLPLTANGKLDRRALPGPDDSAFARSAFEAPQGEVEQALAAIWQQLLNVERVSRFDNFFALGGHSLLAVRLMERLRRRQLPASVQAVFTTRTLAELAATLGQQQEVSVPPLLIGRDCRQITPQMLPLISLSQEEIDSLTARLPGGVAAIQDIYGLSPLQEGILFHHLMSDKGDPYLLIAQLRFDDRAALLRYAAALDRVVARHDVLRTAFVWEGLSEPAQLVLRQVDTVLTELELDDNAPALQQLLARFHPRHYRLDLGQAPLLRLIAARDGDGSWYAVQLWHHLIGDHAALAIQQEEIVAFCSGHADSLPPPTPYRNLIAQARLGVSQQEHEQFFRSMLGDIDTPTLPFGLSDVHANGQGVREAHLALPDALSRGLREQARQLGVSLASLCHLAWGQVLAHTSGNDKVVFGTVLLGRLQAGPEAERILGLVINTLPLRLDIDQRGTREAVQETHAALSRLLGHEHASLTLAQRCSGIAAPAPLFSALLNYRHNQESDGSLPMPAGTTLLSGEERTNYPFVMAVDDDGQSLGLSAQMTAGIAPEHACGWMAQALTSLLAALEKEPQSPVRQLCVVPAAERTLLLETLNQSSQPYPADRCLHDEFEMQAAADPQAIALTCGEQRISYGELNARANQLAHYLMEAGVGPDRRVALCVSRSPSMIVALLAILKAGGAYVPLDPSYPADRLAYIIEDARPVMLLHDAAGREALGEVDIPALSLDNRLPESWPQDNPQRRQATLTAQHLAYILYTSGSTGKPKGVMLDHAAVQCRLDWMRQTYGFCADDVFLQKTTFNFDLSVWEIFCSLQCGAQLALASDADVKDPQRMADLVTREKVTIAQFVPSTLAPFLATQSPDNASPLRLVIFGGEALTPEHLKQCQSVLPRVAFRNMYGPTEAAIDALFWPCPDNYDGSQIAIGRPMAWTAAYVLDEQGDPVPFGAVGELYLGGAGVARGYLNRAELTAERFLDDPFSPLPGARMYRTGDLARY
ncbi:non-ribosomal peptide synthetase, partial [Erwinia amylovora]